MYFWVKNCAFVNPPVKDSIDSGYSGYSSESGVSQESYNEEVDPKIKFYSTIILLLFLSVIPVYFITAGIVKHAECPAESKIPFWMNSQKSRDQLKKSSSTCNDLTEICEVIHFWIINHWIHLELCRFVKRRELSQLLKLRNLA
ncbi:hypothetical protein GCK72_011973 [Caenorhabditis remanei]|uniref:Uncharacterized protein n=1 Tax=Caenorhabditis remanei TaxID=31234 RepID=A0A6A5GLH2_CAERE|nr:hypothetical protein GCK72_011973 [Caenorhabditis remanei]KAF1755523.1 hypothetical protein GCK72_011973 [Caenorhabditis remanei]